MGSQTTTTYFCDDCKIDVDDKKELRNVNYSLYSNEYGCIGTIEKEVCSTCFNYYSKLYDEIKKKVKQI